MRDEEELECEKSVCRIECVSDELERVPANPITIEINQDKNGILGAPPLPNGR